MTVENFNLGAQRFDRRLSHCWQQRNVKDGEGAAEAAEGWDDMVDVDDDVELADDDDDDDDDDDSAVRGNDDSGGVSSLHSERVDSNADDNFDPNRFEDVHRN